MIKIVKPTNIPKKLSVQGNAENISNSNDYDAHTVSYLNGIRAHSFKNAIYGHSSVKSVLKKAQHNKCCFCERDQIEEFGAVEHFRPKAAFKSKRKQKLIKPGYYWLAYKWDNLFFVCGNCNSSKYKGNLFPLVNEARRVRTHAGNITQEDPLLIHPVHKDPRDHIFFRNELVDAKDKYGFNTISICGLDRETLNTKRAEVIDNVNARLVILANEAAHDQKDVDAARKYLKRAKTPTAEFSSCVIDYMASLGVN